MIEKETITLKDKAVYHIDKHGDKTYLYTENEEIMPTDEQIKDGIELLKAQNKNLLDNCNLYKNLYEKNKELLIKYIKHIENICDENYIDRTTSQNIDMGSLFTDEEISELNKLSKNG